MLTLSGPEGDYPMRADRTTKVMLALIAAGLWLNALPHLVGTATAEGYSYQLDGISGHLSNIENHLSQIEGALERMARSH